MFKWSERAYFRDMMQSDGRFPPPQRFVSHFFMFSASPFLLHLHLTLMEKTYIAPWDKKRPHLSSNGACFWIMESQLLLTYTVCLFLISVTPFHASPFIKFKYGYIYIIYSMCVETVWVVEIYLPVKKKKTKQKKHVKIVVKLQCGPHWVKQNNKNGFNYVLLRNVCSVSKITLLSDINLFKSSIFHRNSLLFDSFDSCTSWKVIG